jgi:S-DNA-T family DNA segregation ATPase FtsK/SpoIIIE
MDHIAAGGDSRDALPDVPGRALLDGRMMQWVDAAVRVPAGRATPEVWRPAERATAIVVRAGAQRALADVLAARDIDSCTVDEFAASAGVEAPRAVIGDPDAWLRNWRALADARTAHDLLIDAACAGEYRAITADRELPPYCEPGRGRAWLIRPGEPARRVLLPRPDADSPGR